MPDLSDISSVVRVIQDPNWKPKSVNTAFKRGELCYVKRGARFLAAQVMCEYSICDTIRVKFHCRDWVLRRSEVISANEHRRAIEAKRDAKLRDKYADVLAVIDASDNHVTLAAKLGRIPVVAWQKLAALKRAKLI